MNWKRAIVLATLSLALSRPAPAAEPPRAAAGAPPEFSGIYPHLAMFNNENECGTGAVVPWADRLWVVTYAPHKPKGSSDKLYEIDAALAQTVRPESIGGTPANRMIHSESNQLFIGPYAIDRDRNVRAIPYSAMPGRHTANARHLTDPANKIYYATMEEGFYEVDVKTLEPKALYPDANGAPGGHGGTLLPGYHGKGAYSGQGRLVYANNGDTAREALSRPDVPSGCLAEWDGKVWRVVRRNQFCDVTGPGGITGNERPDTDPLWTVGWDHRSLMLMVLDGGTWHTFRLPKATHTYDGAHGWNTEWPRIRDVGEPDLLMTMHGTFWRFPRTFTAARAAGIRPRSTYLKVIGDFARWNDRIVFGCDDTAKSEFLNKRKAKGKLLGPGQSHSNLWFAAPSLLDDLGPAIGRGSVWANEPVKAGVASDPYLFAGYERRGAHLVHGGDGGPITFEFEIDADGSGKWASLRKVTVPAGGYAWAEFAAADRGEWVRVRPDRDAERVTVQFHYAGADRRTRDADGRVAGVAKPGEAGVVGGLIRVRGDNKRTLAFAATAGGDGAAGGEVGYYEMDATAALRRVADDKAHAFLKKHAPIPQGVLSVDAASVVYVDDAGRRWRLPKGDAAFDALTTGAAYRVDREVCTERDLFNAHGTFYELPAENAGGFVKVRPVTTHNRAITDYCSYRGMLVLTGVAPAAAESNRHVIRSDDGKAAVWVGTVDDLWKLGKPVGRGGPWKDSAAKAGAASDPYLMTGYDKKHLALSQTGADAVRMRVEIDPTGEGRWVAYRTFDVPSGRTIDHEFPTAFQAYWVRVVADASCTATAQLTYE